MIHVKLLKRLVIVSILSFVAQGCTVSQILGTIRVKADVACSWYDANGNAPNLTTEANIELDGLLSIETAQELIDMNDYAINYNEWAKRCK